MAGVLLKCWCAAYINPLRQGRDRLGQGRHSLSHVSRCLSSIIICSSASVCLLALSLSISVLPLILCRSLLAAPLQRPSLSRRAPSIFNARVYIYICAVRESPCFLPSLRSYLSRRTVSVSVRPSSSSPHPSPETQSLLIPGRPSESD